MVYFISDGHGHIKIGVAEHIGNRLKTLQCGNAYELKCVKAFDTRKYRIRGRRVYTDYDFEHLLHHYFKDDMCKTFNSSSEWFHEKNILPLLQIESDEEMNEWIKTHLPVDFDMCEIAKNINEDSPAFLQSELDKKDKYISRLNAQIARQKQEIESLKGDLREAARGNWPESIKEEFRKTVIANVSNNKIHYLIPKEKTL